MLPANAESKIRIFIVEDQEILCHGLKAALTRCNNFVVIGSAADGLTAIEEIEELKPDIVLMDIGLPHVDGIAVTERIRKSCPASRVIILSAHEDEEHVYDAFSAGASGYCLKDIFGHKLQLAIHSVSNGALWVDTRVALKLIDCVEDRKSKMMQSKNEGLVNVSFSSREKQIARCVAEGLRNKEIAHMLKISISTVRIHISNMADKLTVSSRTQLVLKAQRVGLI